MVINGYSKAEGETLYYLHKLILQELIKYEKGQLLEISPGELRLWRQIKKLNKFEMYGCDIVCNDASINYCNLNTDIIFHSTPIFTDV